MKRTITLLAFLLVLVITGTTAQTCGTWYVSPNGSGTTGTPASPVSLDYALQNATPGRNYIKMLGGTYTYTNKLNMVSDVTVEGGYQVSGNDWILSSNSTSTIEVNPPVEFATVSSVTVGHHIGIEANGVSNFTLRNITVDVLTAGVTGTTLNRGRSIYGMYIKNCTGYELSRVIINTGNASDGDAGAAPSGSGDGDAGGYGGSAGNGSNGCSTSQSGGTGGTSGGGASGGGGGAGHDPDCNGLGCNGDQIAGGNGTDGSNGAVGSPNWSIGDIPVPNSANDIFYLPNGQTNGGNGSGGGGGGGGGGATGGTCVCITCGGNNGGAGGAGGAGGLGGNGGFGGGGAFAIYATGTGTGTLTDCTLNPGGSGSGGNGADGQNGNAGTTGTPGQTGGGCVCGNDDGGDGGNGGAGGTGGRGRDGASGLQMGLIQNGGATITQSGTTTPTNFSPVTVTQLKGCTNSEVLVSFTGGSVDLSGMGNPTFINDLNPTTSSYTAGTSPVGIYYTGTGTFDVVINGTKYASYIRIDSTRVLPSFSTMQNNGTTTTICAGTSLDMSTNFTGTAYEWTIVSGTTGSTPSNGGSTQSTSHLFTIDGTYYVKLRIKEDCCGWSIPVYKTITVAPAPAASIDNVLSDTYCDGENTPITLSGTPTGGTFSGPGVSGGSFTPSNANIGQNIITYTTVGTGGCSGLAYDTITINQGPQLSVSGLSATACVNGLPASLQGTPIGGTFTGSGIVDTLNLTFFVPALAGVGTQTVTYSYTDTSNGCSAQLTQTITVNDAPNVSFTGLPSGACVNQPGLPLTGSPAGGTFNGTGIAGSSFYANLAGVGGPYQIEYSYVDPITGCSNVAPYDSVEVYSIPNPNIGEDTLICGQTPITLDAGAGYQSYDWGVNGQTQTITVNTQGTYIVAVTDTNNCIGRDTVLVDLGTAVNPTVTFNGSNSVCDGDTLVLDAGTGYASYQWSDGTTVTQTLDVTQAGTYTVTVTNNSGCSGSSVPLVINGLPAPQPNIQANGPTTLCEGDVLILIADIGYADYQWSNAESGQYITPDVTGSYSVTVTDGNGCEGTSAAINVTVNPAPDVQITANGPLEFCDGESVTLDAGSGYVTYEWCDNSSGQTITIDSEMECDVTVTDNNGCAGTASVSTTVWDPQPFIVVQSNHLSCYPQAATYQWYLDGIAIDGATTQTIPVTDAGVYSVEVTDTNGCSATAITSQTVTPGFDELSIVENLNVYPNPNNGEVTLEMNLKNPSEVVISVRDITGRIIHSSQVNAGEQFKTLLNFRDLSKGMYILQLEIGGERLTRSLVRE